jgi:HEAT repeat protein
MLRSIHTSRPPSLTATLYSGRLARGAVGLGTLIIGLATAPAWSSEDAPLPGVSARASDRAGGGDAPATAAASYFPAPDPALLDATVAVTCDRDDLGEVLTKVAAARGVPCVCPDGIANAGSETFTAADFRPAPMTMRAVLDRLAHDLGGRWEWRDHQVVMWQPMDDATLQAQIAATTTGDPVARARAVTGLGNHGDPRIYPALFAAATGDDEVVREYALRALDRHLTTLAWGDGVDAFAVAAASSVTWPHFNTAFPLNYANYRNISLLTATRRASVLPALLAGTRADPGATSPPVMFDAALNSLCTIPDQAVVQAILPLLSHLHDLRGRQDPSRIFPQSLWRNQVFLDLLAPDARDPLLRICFATACRMHPRPDLLAPLTTLLANTPTDQQSGVYLAILAIGTPAAYAVAAQAKLAPIDQVVIDAELAPRGNQDALARLHVDLRDPGPMVRRQAIFGIYRSGPAVDAHTKKVQQALGNLLMMNSIGEMEVLAPVILAAPPTLQAAIDLASQQAPLGGPFPAVLKQCYGQVDFQESQEKGRPRDQDGDAAARPLLDPLLAGAMPDTPAQRMLAIRNAVASRDPRVGDFLARFIHDPDVGVRSTLAQVMADPHLPKAASRSIMTTLASDADNQVVQQLRYACAAGDDAGIRALLVARAHQPPPAGPIAAQVLAAMPGPDAVSDLLALTCASQPEVRLGAWTAIRGERPNGLPDPRLRSAAMHAMDDADPRVIRQLPGFLAQWPDHHELAAVEIRWLTDADATVRMDAASAFSYFLTDPAAVATGAAVLAPLVDDPDAGVRRNALTTLFMLPWDRIPQPVAILERAARDDDIQIRRMVPQTIFGLGRENDPGTEKILVEMEADPDPWTQWCFQNHPDWLKRHPPAPAPASATGASPATPADNSF